jgi:hypothetical protein
MRLFDKDGVELSFDTPVDNYFTKNQVNNLDEFTIRAVGKTFSISDVKIEDFIGGDIMANQMAFIELNSLNPLVKDTNRTFKLHYDEQREELIYSFKIDDSVGSRFVQRYIAE